MIQIVTFLWKAKHWRKRIGYTQEHVNRLASMFKRHLHIEHEMVAITDFNGGFAPGIRIVPIWGNLKNTGGCFRRLKVFSHEMKHLIGERFAVVDLDVVLVDDVTPIFNRDDPFIIWGEHYRKTPYCGSLMMMDAGCRCQVWDSFDMDNYPSNIKGRWPYGTDQDHICKTLYPNESMWTSEDGIHNFNYTIRRWDRFAKIQPFIKASKYHSAHYYTQLNKRLGQEDMGNIPPEEVMWPYMAGNGTIPAGCRMVLFNGIHDPSDDITQRKYPWVKEHWR